MHFTPPLSPQGEQQLKIVSYEYMLAKFCKWHAEVYGITIQDFNELNKISFTKSLLYPFFTCIGNGSFKLLFELFGDFYALENGPISRVAIESLNKDDQMQFFSFDKDSKYSIQIRNQYESWDQFLLAISNYQIDGVAFNKVTIYIDAVASAKFICKAIDISIENLKGKTGGKFINFEKYELVTLARQHDSWDRIYSYYKKMNIVPGRESLRIPAESADTDRKVYKIEDDAYADA